MIKTKFIITTPSITVHDDINNSLSTTSNCVFNERNTKLFQSEAKLKIKANVETNYFGNSFCITIYF